MNEEMEVLKTIAQRLQAANFPYMITGSIAMNFYAMPRMTRDIDVVIQLETKDVNRLLTIFKDDFYIDQKTVTEAIDQHNMFNIIHNQWVVKVDFIIRKDSEYRVLEFQRRCPVEIEGEKMWIVSPEDLILSKLYWAKEGQSELQLIDVKNILGHVKNLDKKYLDQWVQDLGLQQVYDRTRS